MPAVQWEVEVYNRFIQCQQPSPFAVHSTAYIPPHASPKAVRGPGRPRKNPVVPPPWQYYNMDTSPTYGEIPTPAQSANSPPKSITNESVQVKLELGHSAVLRERPTTDGFTHDWTMFIRGPEGCNIQHFVEKVIFHLHDSFPKPKRVVKEPPYMVSESGYGSFLLPLEIYFKNKEEPRKIRFEYDLLLHLEKSSPVNNIRCEKLTFQNPNEDFRRKLLKAGGNGIPGAHDVSSVPPTAPASAVPAKPHPPPPQPPKAHDKIFENLFGAPLKADAPKKLKDKPGRPRSSTKTPAASKPPPTETKETKKEFKDVSLSSSQTSLKSSSSSLSGFSSKKRKDSSKRPPERCESVESEAKKQRREKERVKEEKGRDHEKRRDHEKTKEQEKKRDQEKARDQDRKRDLERARDQDRKRDLEKAKDLEKKRDQEKARDQDRKRDLEKAKDLEKKRDQEKAKEHDRSSSKSKSSRHTSKERSLSSDKKDRSRHRHHHESSSHKHKSSSNHSSSSSSSKSKSSSSSSHHQEKPRKKPSKELEVVAKKPTAAKTIPQPKSSPPQPPAPSPLPPPPKVKEPEPAPKSPKKDLRPFDEVLSTGEQSDFDPFDDQPQLTDSQNSQKSGGSKALGKMLEDLDNESSEEREMEEDLFPASSKVPWYPRSSEAPKKTVMMPHKKMSISDDENSSSSSSSSDSDSSSSESEDESRARYVPQKVHHHSRVGGKSPPELVRQATPTPLPPPTVTAPANPLPEKELLPEGDVIKAPNGETFSTLLELQNKLQCLKERAFLLRVMDIIKESGSYRINETSFDFDLCCLDAKTVHRIQDYMDSTKA